MEKNSLRNLDKKAGGERIESNPNRSFVLFYYALPSCSILLYLMMIVDDTIRMCYNADVIFTNDNLKEWKQLVVED